MSALFQPAKVGSLDLQHRIVLAPMTRMRTVGGIYAYPSPLMKEYYVQRASVPGTLLISEGTHISARAAGYPGVPGIFTEEQIAAWKEVVDAVHEKGSTIFLQIAAIGRVASLKTLHEGDPSWDVVGPSAIPLTAELPAPSPRALTAQEIQENIEMFATAAENGVHRAGFDGVEVHSASGYLVDQFLQDVSNNRTDEYGGSIENRSRFALDVVQAISKRVGESRTAIRFSPWNQTQDMGMKDPIPQFTHVVSELKTRFPELAYLHLVEPRGDFVPHLQGSNDFIREIWGSKLLITSGGYTRDIAMQIADEAQHQGRTELIAFGRQFLANPDLPRRLKENLSLNPYNRATFYGGGREGYTDYPFHE